MSAYSYLAEVLVDKYDVDKDKIRPEATLTDLGLDSLMVVEFLFDVEDEFNIEVPDDRAEFETLNEAATLIDELIEAKGD
ncbi:MAG: phosphopantetheine-binding protein [Gemmatimonadota bacterium]|jgi:acyl carrier protein|uniref:Carrier domain-containing protein n=1 Tax=marine metagenome TaxID=408172 RepID=A0A381NIW7_9ZZZZ|nr:phosphopantetheine-binding protein [Gemmatimonadota bacterium]MCH2654467.1 phosphopantetheine-binding protein [Gemmatimonadota bacterium]MEC7739926.1 phosphopantetheine-binding protein [Gemmatimonadota bacterium]MEE3137182.1 phosphopantetheine-binding protein [Gemmatimonadota bacterium]|tara:strand:- start:9266 stop:9505 length:240 start_codon:yes stop_codon:yes gene_type:complete